MTSIGSLMKTTLKLFLPKLFRKKIKNYLKKILGVDYIHKTYGKVYMPLYNMGFPLNNKYPDIYNSEGKKLELFFLRDIHGAHLVYSYNKYFEWDRYNFGLDTHFYTHNSMRETMGKPQKRYGMLVESEIIVPGDYKIFEKQKGLENDFDLIFTYSDKILEAIPNARYVPYYIKPQYNSSELGIEAANQYKYKSKNISVIASGKTMVPLHKYRNAIAMQCKTNQLADAYGKFDGGRYFEISEPYKDYRFSIVIENEITPYGFTEKITNCLASMTIPVYLGATKIDSLFNHDGIIHFSMDDDIENVLKQCTKEFYEERIPAIIDNFNRVNSGKTANDIIYEKYLYNDVGKLSPGELLKTLNS
ncbi:hypothetical protein LQZ21_06165 [Treponema sp. TIM-1]|uniref:glycosyltransferase family 10 domain-containing protein n=1 Tax=Treponema sp. TIM-1 TaxID=2898417 RepID=UPI003980A6CD